MKKKINLGFAVCGSFCTHKQILIEIEKLKNEYNILPIITPNVKNISTRFGKSEKFVEDLRNITGVEPIYLLTDAEPIGPKNMIDILVVAPTTGNTLAKFASGITDNAVTMVFKSHIRNNKPVVIGISTNDALGLNLKNIATLLNTKNIYFVPFGQDDAINKPKSLISHYDLIDETIKKALNGEQIQPLLKEK